jgi:hypothetical protein
VVLDSSGEIVREDVLADPHIVTDMLALDDGLIVAGTDLGNGDRTSLFVGRLDDDGTQVWGRAIPGDPYAQVPRVARSGERIAVAWHDGDQYNTGKARLALTDLDGALPTVIDLGPSSAYNHDIAADTFVRVAPGVGSAVFVTAHSRPRGSSQMFDNEVVVSRVATGDGIVRSFAFDGGEVLFVRGLVVLSSGDLVVWGIDEGARFMRRMTETGMLVWHVAIGVEEVVLDGDTLLALGSDELLDLHELNQFWEAWREERYCAVVHSAWVQFFSDHGPRCTGTA